MYKYVGGICDNKIVLPFLMKTFYGHVALCHFLVIGTAAVTTKGNLMKSYFNFAGIYLFPN